MRSFVFLNLVLSVARSGVRLLTLPLRCLINYEVPHAARVCGQCAEPHVPIRNGVLPASLVLADKDTYFFNDALYVMLPSTVLKSASPLSSSCGLVVMRWCIFRQSCLLSLNCRAVSML